MESYLNPLTTASTTHTPLGPQANWQSQVFKLFQKTKRVGADLNLVATMFQRMGGIAEKALHLDPASWNSLTNGVHSMPLLLAWVE